MPPSLIDEACIVLGLPPGGGLPDEEAIQKHFKKLAVQWHPDKHPDNVQEATERFAEISAARDLLLDPPPLVMAGSSYADGAAATARKAAERSNELRAFSGDVSEALADGSLPNAAQLFAEHKLWAVWLCTKCELVCCRIRKDKYSCMCSHRLSAHDPARGFRCGEARCPCRCFEFQVQTDFEPLKCRCKHAAKDHAAAAPHACTKAGCGCEGFSSPWQCNCGHGWSEHRTAFVHQYITPRCREWVTPARRRPAGRAAVAHGWPDSEVRPCAQGLRKETVELANKFRSRSPRTRAAFIRRAEAARAAGLPSYKAVQRAARLDAGIPTRDGAPREGMAEGPTCEECSSEPAEPSPPFEVEVEAPPGAMKHAVVCMGMGAMRLSSSEYYSASVESKRNGV